MTRFFCNFTIRTETIDPGAGPVETSSPLCYNDHEISSNQFLLIIWKYFLLYPSSN